MLILKHVQIIARFITYFDEKYCSINQVKIDSPKSGFKIEIYNENTK